MALAASPRMKTGDQRANLSYRPRGGVDRVVVVFCLSA
jgi:hypothetical protein